MKNAKFLFTLLIGLTIQIAASAQSIGVNTITPDASAILDVQSIDKGMLVPRLSKTKRLGISNPAEGLLVYDTDSKAFWYYESGWKKISDSSKNIWRRGGSFSPAEVGDTSIYFMGKIAIGKDSAVAAFDIQNHGQTGFQLFQSFDNPNNIPNATLIGAKLEVAGELNYREIGVELKMSGKSATEWGRLTQMLTDSSNIQQIASFNDVNGYSGPVGDSTFRDNRGVLNQLSGSKNTYQAAIHNVLSGSSYERQRGIINDIDVYGDGQQIGTYNIISNSGGGEQIGTFNKTGGPTGEGFHYGTKNELNGKNELFGTHQKFFSTTDSTIYGLYNDLDVVFHDGKKYGVYNFLKSSNNDSVQYAINNHIQGSFNSGNHYGLSNTMNASGIGDRFGVENTLSGSSSGKQYGTRNLIDNTGSNIHYGVFSQLEGTGTGLQYGSFQSVTNSGSGQHTGTQNTMGGSGSGIKIGTNNSLSATGAGTQYGIKNTMVGGGGGTHYGAHTSMGASGIGDKYADWNSIHNSKDGAHYGEYTSLSGSGSGIHYGSNIELSGAGTGPQYGHLVDISNSGNSAHFGNRATLTGAGNGFQYGNSNVITNSGSSAHYGTQNTLIGSATGLQFGTYNSVDVSGNGSHYGTYNTVSGTGAGAHIAGYFDASGSGSNRYAAVFNRGKVVINEASGDYDFRVESNSNQNMLFVDASTNRIGIGTNAPEKELDVTGSAIIERNSGSTTPQLTLKEVGIDYARLTFINDQVDTSYWTIAGRVNNTDASSRFNFYYKQSGNVLSLHGDGDAVIQKRMLVGTGEPDALIHAKSNGASSNLIKLESGSTELFKVTTSAHIAIGGTPSGTNINTVYMPTKVSLGVPNPFYRFSLPNDNHEDIGIAIARNWIDYSDMRVKKNVVESSYGLKEIMALRPVQYNHHSSTFNSSGLQLGKDFTKEVGFLAQEVYEVIKEIAKKPEDENKALWGLDYDKLTPVLVKAIQEQQQTIEQLTESNQFLIEQLNSLQSAVRGLQEASSN